VSVTQIAQVINAEYKLDQLGEPNDSLKIAP